MKNVFLICTLFFSFYCKGQFDPQVGYGDNNAIYLDSSVIKSWATECIVTRGRQNISNLQSPLATLGEESFAVGKAGGGSLVSLGDGGSAVLTFAKPIKNGPGSDFAVFENGFNNQDVGNAFLELAFVEVSSDGEIFYRFPAISNTDTSSQIDSYGAIDARKINNLAGKYTVVYGTPFDLEELKTVSGLDVNNITHVKIIDVVGCMSNEYASRDSRGVKVNDPWPTAFASSGFDLDAVAVINEGTIASMVENSASSAKIYPNPISNQGILNIENIENLNLSEIQLYDAFGKTLSVQLLSEGKNIGVEMKNIPSGVYYLQTGTSAKNSHFKILCTE